MIHLYLSKQIQKRNNSSPPRPRRDSPPRPRRGSFRPYLVSILEGSDFKFPLWGLGGFGLRGFFFFLLLIGCGGKNIKNTSPEEALFELLTVEQSGVDFKNSLAPTSELNIFKYLYFYNGAGVATADFNGDGLIDIFFTANQGQNKLYLNKGNLQFEDVTQQVGLPTDEDGWTTGVTLVDINHDGRMDLYVSQLGNYEGIFGKNQLFINSSPLTPKGGTKDTPPSEVGGLLFKESAKEYGLDLVGFSTQAVFFDYDLDGDLDMYMLNHSVHGNGTFERRANLRNEKHQLAGDKLLKNENGKFIEVTEEAGILSSALGYGLGVAVGDVNNDGYPDIYVGNDFHENDYLYLNQQDGTFQEVLNESITHTSRYSMGNDIGDLNNDGWADILTLDMLPAKYETLKASDAEDPLDVYQYKLRYGYNYQFSRNTLQLNLGNGKFSDIGMLAGIYATDWSWASLLADFDLDGYKDIFISNGIPRRLNDLDYIKFISNDVAIQMRLESGQITEKELALTEKMPIIKIPNYLYRNKGDLTFEDKAKAWGLDLPTFSSGSAYADLDNDGDLELVVNNTNDVAQVYKNLSREKKPTNNYLKIRLEGDSLNRFGIGAKVIARTKHGLISQELYTTRGFQSAVSPEIVLGLGDIKSLDSLTIIWPNHQTQTLQSILTNRTLTLKQSEATGKYIFPDNSPKNPLFEALNDNLGIDFVHQENKFVEFNREPLMPHMVSTEGPALAVGDVNNDGKEDFFVGGAKHQSSALYLQTDTGFEKSNLAVLKADSVYEDVEAIFFDADGDQDLDLLVLSGGNEFYGKSEYMRPRLYLNDGKGSFTKDKNAFKEVYLTGGALALADFDKDGDVDIFMGARATPWNYGITPESYLMLNDGKGKFKNIAAQIPDLQKIGLVTSAEWGDLDGDGYEELVVVGEWFPVTVFDNQKGKLQKIDPKNAGFTQSEGFWNVVKLIDLDQDGKLDIVCGNLGLNSKLQANSKTPIEMYVGDFDKNDQVEQLLYTDFNGKKRLFATKDEVSKQLTMVNKKFLSYQEYANAPSEEVISPDLLKKALHLKIYETRSCVFLQKDKLTFEKIPLPSEVQFSTMNSLVSHDFDGDKKPDLLIGGNFYDCNIQMGRYDASYGTLLINQGKGQFKTMHNRQINLILEGQIRNLRMIQFKEYTLILAARNNEGLQILKKSPLTAP